MSGSLLFGGQRPEGAREGVHQGEWWVDVNHQWHKINGMTLGHVENVMALLRSRATVLAMRQTWAMHDYAANAPDGAYYAVTREIEEIERNPLAWLKSTTLYRALKKRRKKLKRAIKKSAAPEMNQIDDGDWRFGR